MTVYMIKKATGKERLTKLHENIERVRIEPVSDTGEDAICNVLDSATGAVTYDNNEWEC